MKNPREHSKGLYFFLYLGIELSFILASTSTLTNLPHNENMTGSFYTKMFNITLVTFRNMELDFTQDKTNTY